MATASPPTIDSLVSAGTSALQAGDFVRARTLLAQAAERPDGVTALLPLANACRLAGDQPGEERALDRLLERQPRNLVALIQRGRAREAAGDERAATAFYKTALANAGSTPLPALRPELDRITRWLAGTSDRFEAYLRRRLADAGHGDVVRTPRLALAIELMMGRSEVYLQQPTNFYYPGLPQRAFYEREQFDWVSEFEQATDAIRTELLAVMAAKGEFDPYVVTDPSRPLTVHELRDNNSWGAFHLVRNGTPEPANIAQCPAAMAALEGVLAPHIPGRSPGAMFSLLKPGAHIPPHHGMLNTRLICHLPLIAPQGCTFRVGAETRSWEQGKLLIFDDSIEHEAWNRSSQTRVILLFDIWRPEIEGAEKAALITLFEAVGNLPE